MAGIALIESIAGTDDPKNLVPDPILPDQFAHSRHQHTRRIPELSLMLAVLEDAIRTFSRSAGSRRRRHQRLFAEEAAWFESHDVERPFAFESICDALGLEPAWIRRGLHEWLRSGIAGADRPAKIPSVRRIATRLRYVPLRVVPAAQSTRQRISREVRASQAWVGGAP